MEHRLYNLCHRFAGKLQTPIPVALQRCGIFPVSYDALEGNHVYDQSAVDLLEYVCGDDEAAEADVDEAAMPQGTIEAAASDEAGGVEVSRVATFKARIAEGLSDG